ncbi:MAG: DUF108 domain-containing protein [SAR202 cluster bacterium]|nr:DUF108 domain-containing protein [SAR202 cluster bacterium]
MNHMDRQIRVAILGCGTIGSELATFIDSDECQQAQVSALYDLDQSRSISLRNKLLSNPRVTESIEEILLDADVSLVIEAAGPDAIQSYSKDIVLAGKHLMVMSVGGLLHGDIYAELDSIASESGSQIFVPSGAVGGIDAIKACRDQLDVVILTTKKHPDTILDISVGNIKKDSDRKYPREIFYGTALDAVKRFPFNINVAATISLAGIGPIRTMVKIVADPQVSGNVHEIYASGSSGIMRFTMENIPHPENPRTSYMAILAAIETMKHSSGRGIRIGT